MVSELRVLYVGPLNETGTCFSRLKALKELHEPIDTLDTSYVGEWGNKFYRYAENQLCFGYTFLRANRELIRKAFSTYPTVIWIDKGFWVWSRTLRLLRSSGFFLVQHNTDDINAEQGRLAYRLMRKTLKYYDINFTTNHYNIEEIQAVGADHVVLTSLGFDHEKFYPYPLTAAEKEKWTNSIVFIGHRETNTEKLILSLVKAEIPITVYGYNWHKANNHPLLKNVIHSEFLINTDYVNCLRGAQIGLGFISKLNRNQTAGRTFEIPACGTFLLGERTSESIKLFQEGTEAEFFNGDVELVNKAKFYLNNDLKREEIAKRGYERVQKSGYSWLDSMRKDWKVVCENIQTRK